MTRILTILTILAVVILHFFYTLSFTVDFPFLDDFLFIQFIETTTQKGIRFVDFISELFKTFNDHKAVIPRLVAWLDYQLTGQLHFKFYILLTSLNLTYICWFFFHEFKKLKLPLYYFLPIPFLFFQPLYHEVSGWALTGMQHSYLTAFLVTAVMLVSNGSRPAFFGAMMCCLLATFTHGNGILTFPAIIFYFLCTKNFKKASVTFAFMLAALTIYLAGYERGQSAHMPREIGLVFTSLFCFIGSGMALWQQPEIWAGIWGAAITGMMAALGIGILKNYRKPDAEKPIVVELLTLFAFIFITSLIVAIFRSWSGTTIASRFQLYGTLATIIFYLLGLEHIYLFRKKAVFYAVAACSMFYCGYSYYLFTGTVALKKAAYEADIYNWQSNRRMFTVEKSFIRNAEFYLLPAYRKGILKFHEPVIGKKQIDSLFRVAPGPSLDFKVYMDQWNLKKPTADGWEPLCYHFVSSNDLPDHVGILSERFLVLHDQKKNSIHLLPANPKVEARKTIITTGSYYKNGFNALIRPDDLDQGGYDLAVLDIDGNGKRNFYKLGKTLLVGGGKLSLN